MIDHVTIRVSNIERAKEFYAKTLLPLGYSLQYEDNYFGAFAIDPDGNNIEAVCHKSEN